MKGEYGHRVVSIKGIIALLSIIGIGLIFVFPLRNTLAQAPGDANDDGMINVQDVIVTINQILGIAAAPGDPDCNMDTMVNIQDVICIINIILGIAPTPTPTPTPTPAPMIQDVSIIDNQFVDSVSGNNTTTIPVGTTVRWTNNGEDNHTSTSDEEIWNSDDDFPMPAGMQPGDQFIFTFTEAGTFPYFCEFHGAPGGIGMSGTVTVTP